MQVLIDSSIWINYFKGGDESSELDRLLDDNIVATNDIIMAELVPFLRAKNQRKVIRLLREINRLPLNIAWEEIIEFQVKCLRNGSNGVGIVDLLIAQNAIANNCSVYSLDKHFGLLHKLVRVELYNG